MLSAQVSGGCGCDSVATTPDLMSVDAAVARAVQAVTPIRDIQTIPLDRALGRTTATAVFAPDAMPFFDNSAMDGFALRVADLTGRCCLPVAGTVAAGDAPRALPEGAALRIYTGAPLPSGADVVVMLESCIDKTHKVHIAHAPTAGDNIRRAGSDQAMGQDLLRAGIRINAHHIGLLAANGVAEINVVRRPGVAVFSTGDELSTEMGTELNTAGRAPGQIFDANRPMLIALARQAGADVTDLGIIADDLDLATVALNRANQGFDLILSSGAVSLGGKDHICDALVAAGGTVHGWRVALKPGKPVMFGTLGRAAFTGLPGNPFAVHVGFHMFALPQIARLLGADPAPFASVPAIAGFEWIRKPGRAEVFPVRLTGHDATGLPVLQRLGHSVSATLLPLSGADGLAIVPADTSQIRSGAPLFWRPFCQTGDLT